MHDMRPSVHREELPYGEVMHGSDGGDRRGWRVTPCNLWASLEAVMTGLAVHALADDMCAACLRQARASSAPACV